jgi:hypothetical protein
LRTLIKDLESTVLICLKAWNRFLREIRK